MGQFSAVQSLSCVQLFVTTWTAAHQATLFIANSQSLLRLMSIELVMPSNNLTFCCLLLLPPSICPSTGSSKMSQLFVSGCQRITVSTSASVFPINIQDWSPLGWTGWISLQSRDPQESSPTPQFKSINSSGSAFFIVQLSHPYMTTGNHSLD